MPTSGTLMPRDQQGADSQQLLTVLLGDYWYQRSEPVPSAALVELLQNFEVTAAGARAAIRRLAQRGFLKLHRVGRSTAYEVRAAGQGESAERTAALFMGKPRAPWDGSWTIVAYSLPETSRTARNALRELLRKRKFGNLYDGIWIGPGDQTEVVQRLLGELGLAGSEDITCFLSAKFMLPGEMMPALERAFGLAATAAGYARFVERWQPVADEMRVTAAGDLEPDDESALRVRTTLMREWRELRHADPMLPRSLFAADHPLREAAALCAYLYDELGPQAEGEFREIIGKYDEELRPCATHHTFEELSQLAR